ncbi:Uncharacterized protein OBRU01_06753, partial [Operophtera brumata]
SDIKSCQQKLVAQLVNLLRENLGVPARRLLARCLATLFSVGDTFLLFDTVNKCNDIIKVLRRDRVDALSRASRNALMSDRAPPVRAAAAHALRNLLPLMKLTPADLDAIAAACLRAAQPSDYTLRCAIAELLGTLIATTQAGESPILKRPARTSTRFIPGECYETVWLERNVTTFLNHVLDLVANPKAASSHVDASPILKRPARTSTRFIPGECYETVWLERNLTTFLNHVLDLVANPKAASSHVDAVFSGECYETVWLERKLTTFLNHVLDLVANPKAASSHVDASPILKRPARTSTRFIPGECYETVWLERNLTTFLNHVLDLVANPKAASSHVDAVYSSLVGTSLDYIPEPRSPILKRPARTSTRFIPGECYETVWLERNLTTFLNHVLDLVANPKAASSHVDAVFSGECYETVWLERKLTTFLNHVLDLVANPKAASWHVDTVYSRKCINYILRNTLGKMLGEKAQASACREIIQVVIKQMNMCALMEAGELALQLGTSVQNLVSDSSLSMVDAVCAVLEHPCVAARLAAAWCVRCVCVALPSQITPLLD